MDGCIGFLSISLDAVEIRALAPSFAMPTRANGIWKMNLYDNQAFGFVLLSLWCHEGFYWRDATNERKKNLTNDEAAPRLGPTGPRLLPLWSLHGATRDACHGHRDDSRACDHDVLPGPRPGPAADSEPESDADRFMRLKSSFLRYGGFTISPGDEGRQWKRLWRRLNQLWFFWQIFAYWSGSALPPAWRQVGIVQLKKEIHAQSRNLGVFIQIW